MSDRVSQIVDDLALSVPDWRFDPYDDHWPSETIDLTDAQRAIVKRNSDLLQDEIRWAQIVELFNVQLLAVSDAVERKQVLNHFCVRFDGAEFGEESGNPLDLTDKTFPVAVCFKEAKFFSKTNFSRSNFSGEAVFDGAVFHDDTEFEQVQFAGGLNFCAAKLDGAVSFTGSTISGYADFSYTEFSERTEFNEVKFYENAYFGNVLFSDSCGFASTRFDAEADFGQTKFIELANFRGADFIKAASFSSAIFDGASVFSGVTFNAVTVFAGAVFNDHADFASSNFTDVASFSNTRFVEEAIFYSAKFSEGVSFGQAEFSSSANFTEVTINKDAWFDGVKGLNSAFIAKDLVVDGNFYLNSSVINHASFARMRVNGTSSFANTKFLTLPDFRDSALDRPPEVANMDVPEPSLSDRCFSFKVCSTSPKDGEDGYEEHSDEALQVAKYRKLKAMALAANDHEKDGEFFAYEMLAKRGVETNDFSGLLFNSIYFNLSNFGQSYLPPMKGLVIAWASFTFVYLAATYLAGPDGPFASLAAALGFSIWLSTQSLVPFLGSLVRFAPTQVEGHPNFLQRQMHALADSGYPMEWLTWLTVLQQFIGAVLLFLFLLALRNKFRLK